MGLGAVIGFRLPFSYNESFLSLELDATLDLSDIEGVLVGVGISAAKNQLGESWPDGWSIDANQSFGATLKLSGKPGILSTLDTTAYVLAGIRQFNGDFTNQYYGCLDPIPCSADITTPNFVSGSETRGITLDGYVIGLGLGKELAAKTVLRLEGRFTEYEGAEWEDFFEVVNVNVVSTLDSRSLSFGIFITRYL